MLLDFCKCGCKTKIINPDNRGRYRTFIRGHHMSRINKLEPIKYKKMYKTWAGIKTRCINSNNPKYRIYGGRGIRVCDKWLKFDGFYEDMESTWRENLSIDRIDNNGNYYKENCRWATVKEQQNNKRNIRLHEYNGQKHTLTEWSHILDIRLGTLIQRYNIYHWRNENLFRKVGYNFATW